MRESVCVCVCVCVCECVCVRECVCVCVCVCVLEEKMCVSNERWCVEREVLEKLKISSCLSSAGISLYSPLLQRRQQLVCMCTYVYVCARACM